MIPNYLRAFAVLLQIHAIINSRGRLTQRATNCFEITFHLPPRVWNTLYAKSFSSAIFLILFHLRFTMNFLHKCLTPRLRKMSEWSCNLLDIRIRKGCCCQSPNLCVKGNIAQLNRSYEMMTHILFYATLQPTLQPTTISAYSLACSKAQALIGIGQDETHCVTQ